MELIRLTQKNVSKYIGYEILFKTRGNHIVKKILGIVILLLKLIILIYIIN